MSGREPCSGRRQHPPSPLPGGRTWILATAGTPRASGRAWAAKTIQKARGHLPGASTATTEGVPGSFGEGGGREGSHPAQSAPTASPLHHHALLDSGLQDAKGKKEKLGPRLHARCLSGVQRHLLMCQVRVANGSATDA